MDEKMKEIWRKIEEFDNYSVSNKGQVRNDNTDHKLKQWNSSPSTKLLCVSFYKAGKTTTRMVHKLVAEAFDKLKPEDTTAIHVNYVQFDNREPNLEGSTTGKAIVRTRKYNRLKAGKIKGIYAWHGKKDKFRAILSLEDGKMGTKLLGYFETREEAVRVYHKAYLSKFKTEPFKLEDHV